MPPANQPIPRLTLPRTRRLAHDREYDAVFAAKVRSNAGPLTVFSLQTDRAFCRLGLSIGKRVGGAVVRNRLKRMLRESFRLTRAEHSINAPFFDFVVSSRAHKPATLVQYQAWMLEAVSKSRTSWKRREPQKKSEHVDRAQESA